MNNNADNCVFCLTRCCGPLVHPGKEFGLSAFPGMVFRVSDTDGDMVWIERKTASGWEDFAKGFRSEFSPVSV